MTQPALPARLLGRSLPVELGSYIVNRPVAGGASYADYEAVHATLGHRVLFRHERWPSGEHLSTDPGAGGALDGLRRSRRLQAELQHPRIVPVLDFFQHEGEWFSVFATVPGTETLAALMSAIRHGHRPPLDLAAFVALCGGVTEGLAAMHRAGFVHRTLASSNITVDADGFVRLADLGCATPIGADDAAARAFRMFMRPASAAPEQFAEQGVFSPATDAWALGVLLFELRYGRHPCWDHHPGTLEAIAVAVTTREVGFSPAPDTSGGEDLIQSWLRRLLAPLVADRYGDALEAQRDLQAIAAQLSGRPPVARAFVAMPFAPAFDGMWRAISAACAACGVAAVRVDQTLRHQNIWDEICDAIRSCDITIAVASQESGAHNPNVMLEIGYARALQKPILLLTASAETLPFDLRTQRALCYQPDAVGGGGFHRELAAFVTGLVAARSSPAHR